MEPLPGIKPGRRRYEGRVQSLIEAESAAGRWDSNPQLPEVRQSDPRSLVLTAGVEPADITV